MTLSPCAVPVLWRKSPMFSSRHSFPILSSARCWASFALVVLLFNPHEREARSAEANKAAQPSVQLDVVVAKLHGSLVRPQLFFQVLKCPRDYEIALAILKILRGVGL